MFTKMRYFDLSSNALTGKFFENLLCTASTFNMSCIFSQARFLTLVT